MRLTTSRALMKPPSRNPNKLNWLEESRMIFAETSKKVRRLMLARSPSLNALLSNLPLALREPTAKPLRFTIKTLMAAAHRVARIPARSLLSLRSPSTLATKRRGLSELISSGLLEL